MCQTHLEQKTVSFLGKFLLGIIINIKEMLYPFEYVIFVHMLYLPVFCVFIAVTGRIGYEEQIPGQVNALLFYEDKKSEKDMLRRDYNCGSYDLIECSCRA